MEEGQAGWEQTPVRLGRQSRYRRILDSGFGSVDGTYWRFIRLL